MTYRGWRTVTGAWPGDERGRQKRVAAAQSRERVLVDASYRPGLTVVAAVRHSDGRCLHRLELGGVASSMQAEMLAIEHGLATAWERGWRNVVVVTDNRVCELLARRPGEGGGGPHVAHPLKVVRQLLRLMPEAEVVWAPRARLRAAHAACR